MTREKLTPPPAGPKVTSEEGLQPGLQPFGAPSRAPRGSALARALEDLREAGGMGGVVPSPPPADLGPAAGDARDARETRDNRDAQEASALRTPPLLVEPFVFGEEGSAAEEAAETKRVVRSEIGADAPAAKSAAKPAAKPAAESAAESAAEPAATLDQARTEPRSLDNTLTSTIRRWAKPTTPKELEARGVKRVRSVSMSRIASLIEKAINRELIARTLDGDTDDALSLSANARAGFLELARTEMSGRVDVGADSSAFADLDRLRDELEARRAELEERGRSLDGSDFGVEDEALERRLRAVFASRPERRDPELERAVVQAALGELGEMRSRAAERRMAESRRETRQLERRITKLAGLLEQTEGELRRTRARGAQETGVASIYSEVQGLDEGDGRLEQKKDLMKCIFEANLELQH
ncbi:hypothetical protein OAV47_01240 [bacterium]|nr:hypothetical protein [bacterium]